MKKPVNQQNEQKRRSRPFPNFRLEESLAIVRSIVENNASKPYARLSIADSLKRSPSSSSFRDLISSSSAYGLTEGGFQAVQLKPTELGLAIVSPRSDRERAQALVNAVMNIELFKKLYGHFDQHRIPPEENFKNTLVRDYGLEREVASTCFKHFVNDGRFVGIVRQVSGADHVDLSGPAPGLEVVDGGLVESDPNSEAHEESQPSESPRAVVGESENRRVFLTHGKNRAFLEPLKKLLRFGEMEAVVAAERESVSLPVPDKVMADMRRCGAAVIHVDDELRLLSQDGVEHTVLNPNVLIEIGAAMALYGRRFILLVKEGVKLPSNLQGLYEVRYSSEKLDGETTIKLLEAINDIKNHALPSHAAAA